MLPSEFFLLLLAVIALAASSSFSDAENQSNCVEEFLKRSAKLEQRKKACIKIAKSICRPVTMYTQT